jgi:hypothetical protein
VTLVLTSVIDVLQDFDKDEWQPISGLLYCRQYDTDATTYEF